MTPSHAPLSEERITGIGLRFTVYVGVTTWFSPDVTLSVLPFRFEHLITAEPKYNIYSKWMWLKEKRKKERKEKKRNPMHLNVTPSFSRFQWHGFGTDNCTWSRPFRHVPCLYKYEYTSFLLHSTFNYGYFAFISYVLVVEIENPRRIRCNVLTRWYTYIASEISCSFSRSLDTTRSFIRFLRL